MILKISIVPDRLAHYRVPVFSALNSGLSNGVITIYADLSLDSSKILKPSKESLQNVGFNFIDAKDIRVRDRLFFSTGSFKAIFDDSKVVIIWGDAFCPGNWLAILILKFFTNKKIGFWTHGVYGDEKFLKKSVRLAFYKLADSLLLYGGHASRCLKSEGFKEDKLYVINNSLDTRRQDYLYNKNKIRFSKISHKTIKLLFVGRLTKVKKLNFLLEAVKTLSEKHEVQLKIVGDGDQFKMLIDLADRLGVGSLVSFCGEIYDEEVLAEHIMNADLVVSPGNVGLTAMHALVYGTPVVSHSNARQQMPEFEAIRPSLSGELFEEDNVKSLVQAILRCKENLVFGRINPESCRSIISKFYSSEYQVNVFRDFLHDGLGIQDV